MVLFGNQFVDSPAAGRQDGQGGVHRSFGDDRNGLSGEYYDWQRCAHHGECHYHDAYQGRHALWNEGIIPLVKQPVVLEDHCFIGVNAVIMPGVTIGRGSVVTSGSVVLTNVPPAVMVTAIRN